MNSTNSIGGQRYLLSLIKNDIVNIEFCLQQLHELKNFDLLLFWNEQLYSHQQIMEEHKRLLKKYFYALKGEDEKREVTT